MAISVNKITLVGNVGSDPEQSGNGPVRFSLATSKRYKKDGEAQEKTTWHKIVIWNEMVQKFALQYVKKGDMVYLEGEMDYRVWEKDGGEKVNLAEVCVQPYTGVLQAVSRSGDGNRAQREESRQEERPSSFGGSSGGRGGSGYTGRDLDDEIPF